MEGHKHQAGKSQSHSHTNISVSSIIINCTNQSIGFPRMLWYVGVICVQCCKNSPLDFQLIILTDEDNLWSLDCNFQ